MCLGHTVHALVVVVSWCAVSCTKINSIIIVVITNSSNPEVTEEERPPNNTRTKLKSRTTMDDERNGIVKLVSRNLSQQRVPGMKRVEIQYF